MSVTINSQNNNLLTVRISITRPPTDQEPPMNFVIVDFSTISVYFEQAIFKMSFCTAKPKLTDFSHIFSTEHHLSTYSTANENLFNKFHITSEIHRALAYDN